MPQTLKLRYNEMVKERFANEYELTKIEVDDDLAYMKAEKDGATMEHIYEAYKCEKIKKIRLAKLNAEGAVYVRNAVIVPCDNYDLPLFSYDIVESVNKLFAIIDIIPWRKTEEYRKKYVEPMKPIKEKHSNIPVLEKAKQELSDWGREFESGYKFYLRCEKKYEPRVEEAFKDYLELYMGYLKEAVPIEDEAIKKEILDYKKYYQEVYQKNDPGKGPVTVFFGKEWADRFFADFPF
ncbi:MAG: hypothetical protein D6734_00335 [Candidatus Schekmanbacteria bacterium]|nr:MAG: hypothetical protein D6734_00335 [Candidatus Schekmanbacteria bacterium]